jgi:hypothetical protein
MAFAGSRTTGERRRRRLAVEADRDGESVDAPQLGIPLAELLQRSAASRPVRKVPGLPVRAWLMWTIVGTLATLMAGLLSLVALADKLPAALAPISQALLLGSRPAIVLYTETILWILIAELALLVGWCRSCSPLDFAGRYRIWPRAAIIAAATSLCIATGVHHGIQTVCCQLLERNIWRPEVTAWLIPIVLFWGPTIRLLDRDLRGDRTGLILFRMSITMLAIGLLADGLATELADYPWMQAASPLWRLWGSFWLAISLWVHLRFVAYETADPPSPEERKALRLARLISVIHLPRFLKRRAAVADTPAARRRRKKATEETDEAETTEPVRRTRKKPASASTTTKTKRTTKPRVRVESSADESGSSAEMSLEELEAATRPESSMNLGSTANRSQTEFSDDVSSEETDSWNEQSWNSSSDNSYKSKNQKQKGSQNQSRSQPELSQPAPAPAQPQASAKQGATKGSNYSSSSDDDIDGDDDSADTSYRTDGGQGSSDPYKGLSKRQRRELKRQMRD